jgi:hypothetical protein
MLYFETGYSSFERWGEKYLDYDEVTPTNKIIQGKWKLSEEDKYKALAFSNCDIELLDLFTTLQSRLYIF